MRVTQHKFTQTPREVHQVRLTTAKNLILFNVREKALEQRGRVCDLFSEDNDKWWGCLIESLVF